MSADAVVVGAGLAGAAVAHALAQRGLAVTVLDAHAQPAAAASGAPAGLMASHASNFEVPLSQLTRLGVLQTLAQAQTLLRQGQDWQASGALQLARVKPAPPPERWPPEPGWYQLHALGLWHSRAAWIKPAALVRAWLKHSNIAFRGLSPVSQLRQTTRHNNHQATQWLALDQRGEEIVRAPTMVVAAAHASVGLLRSADVCPRLPFDHVAGQLLVGPWSGDLSEKLPLHPLNGRGHFVPRIAADHGGPPFWLAGASYDRDTPDDSATLHTAWQKNHGTLTALLAPEALELVTQQYRSGRLSAWRGYRCTTSDRLPVAGPVAPGLWLSCAMGSRGLSFAALCAELLATQICDTQATLPTDVASVFAPTRFR